VGAISGDNLVGAVSQRGDSAMVTKRIRPIGMFDEVSMVTADVGGNADDASDRARPTPRISKSKFVAGVQCLKRLYWQVYDPELGARIPNRLVIEQGEEVGRLARLMFPGGVEVEAGRDNLGGAVRITRELVRNPAVPAIFEGAFEHGGVFVRVDILQRRGKNQWRLLEVKSSADLKEHYLYDVGIQTHVVSRCGLKLSSANLVHVNRDYVFAAGSFDLKRFFRIQNLNRQLKQFQRKLASQLKSEFKVLRQSDPPDVAPGRHCRKPVPCEFFEQCNPPRPADHVGYLPRIHASAVAELTDLGVDSICDIPDDFPLNEMQQRARASVAAGKTWCNPDLRKQLATLKYPLCFMDFETVNPAVPRFPGMRPFTHIPIQWSVHRQETPGAELRHSEFLADDAGDPRQPFLKSLFEAVEGAGAVVVYNQTFESGRLSDLAKWFPQFAKKIARLQTRLWDLLPFVRENVYHPAFQGSFSLKRVLPALVPEMSYEGLEVGNGAEASAAWEQMHKLDPGDPAKQNLRKSLLEYCRQDTLAMVRLYEALKQLAP
jgi:hypothetical protein